MKPIQLPQQTITALLNGATVVIEKIELTNFSKELGNESKDIEKVVMNDKYTHSVYFKNDDSQTTENKLQLNQTYYVQEECLLCECENSWYDDYICYDMDNNKHFFAEYQAKKDMQPHQSRIKITPIKSEVKKVIDMIDDDKLMDEILPNNWQYLNDANNIYDDFTNNQNEEISDKRYNTFITWYESQFGTYNENDHTILHTVEVEK